MIPIVAMGMGTIAKRAFTAVAFLGLLAGLKAGLDRLIDDQHVADLPEGFAALRDVILPQSMALWVDLWLVIIASALAVRISRAILEKYT